MSPITRLLSYQSFGAKNSFERQTKSILIRRVDIGYSWPSSSFSFPTVFHRDIQTRENNVWKHEAEGRVFLLIVFECLDIPAGHELELFK